MKTVETHRSGGLPVRSARVKEETWEEARARADDEGHSMSKVVSMLVEGYAKGHIDLPKLVYTPTRQRA